MTEDALCADPASSGSASAGHEGIAASPAHERRRLTAESFKALTARLKTAAEPAPFSAPSTTFAPSPAAADEPVPAAPFLQGGDAEGASLPAAHQAVNGGQTAASATAEPEHAISFNPFETASWERAAGEVVEQPEQALSSVLDYALAGPAGGEPPEVPEATPLPSFDGAVDESTIGETPAAAEQASPFETAETSKAQPAGETDEIAARDAREFERIFEEPPASQAPEVSEEMLPPEPGDETGEPVDGETAEQLEQIEFGGV